MLPVMSYEKKENQVLVPRMIVAAIDIPMSSGGKIFVAGLESLSSSMDLRTEWFGRSNFDVCDFDVCG
jgi:hypothetical protein